jgi:hypothetical protein
LTKSASRFPIAAAVALFAAVNAGMLVIGGVREGGDSGLYIDAARRLLAHESLAGRQLSYLGYAWALALMQSIGAGLTGVVVLQIAMATLAAWVVFRIGTEIGGIACGVLATLWLTFDVDTNRWNLFVLSNSLYASMLVLSVWLVHRASEPAPRRWPRLILALAALLGAGLVRPEGWLLIPLSLTYVALRGLPSPQRWVGVAAAIGVFGVVALFVAPRLSANVEAVGPVELMKRGQTIWEYDGWRVSMPGDVGRSPHSAGLADALTYSFRHPVAVLELAAARLAVHAGHVRPYYSTMHNAFIITWLVPIYVASVRGFWALRRAPLAAWSASAIVAQAVVVAFTHADWDGRYLAHVLPLVYPFAGYGVATLVSGAHQRT